MKAADRIFFRVQAAAIAISRSGCFSRPSVHRAALAKTFLPGRQ
jgi:hypothetical protein